MSNKTNSEKKSQESKGVGSNPIDTLKLREVNGVSKDTEQQIITALKSKGIDDVSQFARLKVKDMTDLEGIGKKTGEKILEFVREKIENQTIDEDTEDELLEDDDEEIDDDLEDNDSYILQRNDLRRLDLENDGEIGLKSKAEEIYKALHDEGIHDLNALILYSKDELSDSIKGVGDAKAEALLRKAQEIAGQKAFAQLSEVTVEADVIWTGSLALDNLLGGGIFTDDSYEFYGGFGGGKTQICATISCRIQLPVDRGGLYIEGQPRPEVLWIDTEDTLKQMKRNTIVKEKAKKMAKKKDKSVDEVLHDIIVKRQKGRLIQIAENLGLNFEEEVDPYITHVPCITVDDQMRKIEESLMYANEHNWRLIILDSVTKLIRAERTKDEPYNVKISRNINNMIANLHRLKQKCGAALVCTNQVWNKTDGYGGVRSSEQSYGGGAITHNLNNRVHVWETKNSRVAELKDSSYLSGRDPLTQKEGPVPFVINDSGIGDL